MGVSAENVTDYLLELTWAVARGQLEPCKFSVAVKAAAITEDQSSTLTHVLWCGQCLLRLLPKTQLFPLWLCLLLVLLSIYASHEICSALLAG